jgi:hypothetical protein
MSNEEFDNLKEELMWEGSSVVMLSKHACLFAPLLIACVLKSIFAKINANPRPKVWRRYKLPLSCVLFPAEDEQKLLEASMAYAAGSPIMSDAEFDELKLKLKVGPLLPSCVLARIYTHTSCPCSLIKFSAMLFDHLR